MLGSFHNSARETMPIRRQQRKLAQMFKRLSNLRRDSSMTSPSVENARLAAWHNLCACLAAASDRVRASRAPRRTSTGTATVPVCNSGVPLKQAKSLAALAVAPELLATLGAFCFADSKASTTAVAISMALVVERLGDVGLRDGDFKDLWSEVFFRSPADLRSLSLSFPRRTRS